MKIQILASSPEAAHERQYASCYLLNGNVAIDAGPLGLWGTPQQQAAVSHIFLTHTHIDHLATLSRESRPTTPKGPRYEVASSILFLAVVAGCTALLFLGKALAMAS